MEQLNRLEIRGNVGNVNILRVGDTRVAHFSVATNFAYKGRNGEPVIETTWHNVTAWEGNKGIPSLDIICKGFPICRRQAEVAEVHRKRRHREDQHGGHRQHGRTGGRKCVCPVLRN